jgi:folate-binding protein YgfZ
MSTHLTLLNNRSVLRLSGRDARTWLQGLVTNDVENIGAGEGCYAALLTPQGKIMFDFFIVPDGEALLIDCRADHTTALLKRLLMYKLRADIALNDASASLMVAAAWGDAPPPVSRAIVYADPRAEQMGWRMIGEAQEFDLMGIESGLEDAYAAHRIACGIPEGGEDFAYNDAFPHEANMDLVNGVDFRKGCYIGQEVVSRVHHRGTARKRIVAVRFDGAPPAKGAPVTAGELAIGEMGSSLQGLGLAALRTDRLEEARIQGARLLADGVQIKPI